MESESPITAQNREHAGRLLALQLASYRGADAVVVGISRGGVLVAVALAAELNLPVDVIPCRKIKDPGTGSSCIGSVSAGDVMIDECSHDLPQDYIAHQIAMIRHSLKSEDAFYHQNLPPQRLAGKTVILTDDFIWTGHTIAACLADARRQGACALIVASPLVAARAVASIHALADRLVFLRMEKETVNPRFFFSEFAEVDAATAREALAQAYAQHASYPGHIENKSVSFPNRQLQMYA